MVRMNLKSIKYSKGDSPEVIYQWTLKSGVIVWQKIFIDKEGWEQAWKRREVVNFWRGISKRGKGKMPKTG